MRTINILVCALGCTLVSATEPQGQEEEAKVESISLETFYEGGTEPSGLDLVIKFEDGLEEVLMLVEDTSGWQAEGFCSFKTLDGEPYEALVTGCEDQDRAVTIAGLGSWEIDSAEGEFRRIELHSAEGGIQDIVLAPPEDDVDAKMMQMAAKSFQSAAMGAVSSATADAFKMEVRYYYENSLLNKFGGHNQAIAKIHEYHAHAAILLKHQSIGRRVLLESRVQPVHWNKHRDADGGSIDEFTSWLRNRGDCPRTVAFHHLITAKGNEGTAGIAWVGTVCHSNCQNNGVSEEGWGGSAHTGKIVAHEIGHNLGMYHTFDARHKGKGCEGVMSYDSAFDRAQGWSSCTRGDWHKDYNNFVAALGQSRADQCFVPTSGVPSPGPTPTPPTPKPKPVDTLVRGTKVRDVEISQYWTLEFMITARGTRSGWSNVVHMSANGNNHGVGARIPGIWFRSGSTRMHVCVGCGSDWNVCLDTPALPVLKESPVKVEVFKDVFSVSIDGAQVASTACKNSYDPSEGQKAALYASDPWYNAANAEVRQIVYKSASDDIPVPTPTPTPPPTPKPTPPPTAKPTPPPTQSTPQYEVIGQNGKCLNAAGGDPKHKYYGGVGSSRCRSLCDEREDCHGYSPNRYGNCLLWLEPGLKAGGGYWGRAQCIVKKSKDNIPVVPTPTNSYVAKPGKGWCVTAQFQEGTARYFNNGVFSKQAAEARCNADPKCVAYAWSQRHGQLALYSDGPLCTNDCHNKLFQNNPAVIAQGSWCCGQHWWHDAICHVRQ